MAIDSHYGYVWLLHVYFTLLLYYIIILFYYYIIILSTNGGKTMTITKKELESELWIAEPKAKLFVEIEGQLYHVENVDIGLEQIIFRVDIMEDLE